MDTWIDIIKVGGMVPGTQLRPVGSSTAHAPKVASKWQRIALQKQPRYVAGCRDSGGWSWKFRQKRAANASVADTVASELLAAVLREPWFESDLQQNRYLPHPLPLLRHRQDHSGQQCDTIVISRLGGANYRPL